MVHSLCLMVTTQHQLSHRNFEIIAEREGGKPLTSYHTDALIILREIWEKVSKLQGINLKEKNIANNQS